MPVENSRSMPAVIRKPDKPSRQTDHQPAKSCMSSASIEEEWLEHQVYFHGVLPREEIAPLLKNEGDFLVRESQKDGIPQIVLSVFSSGSQKHFVVQVNNKGHFHFEGKGFSSIPKLIAHYKETGSPITTESKAVLRRAVTLEYWQLHNDHIKMECAIGKGNFGIVYKGFYEKPGKNREAVAIKVCSENASEEQRKKFLQEARIQRLYNHENIVRVIGVAARRNPTMIVLEYVAGGPLLTWLLKQKIEHKKVEVAQLMKFALDATKGMEYLHLKKCIHRDLAARNCLLTEKGQLKIADFGLSREGDVYEMEGVKEIPVKWTAPETLVDGICTFKLDVWSFGVLLWEMFSMGETPYAGLNNKETVEFLNKGKRLDIPKKAPSEVADLINKCWQSDPEKRTSFTEIKKIIETILSKSGSK